jgi:OFA family oxalate/formate antiporter-like MFS transporter
MQLPGLNKNTTKNRSFFYGWVIVLGAIIGQYASLGGRGQVTGIFMGPVTTDLGWSISQYTVASSLAFAVGGLCGPFIGPLVDRYGPRNLMIIGAVTYGASLATLSQINSLWHFMILQLIAGGLGAILVGPLTVNVAVSRWFVLKRGWALAIGSSGVSLAAILMPIIMIQVVDRFGWQDSYIILALLISIPVLIIAPLMKKNPEEMGLLPDGNKKNTTTDEHDDSKALHIKNDFDYSITRHDALRMKSLWLLVLAFGINGAGLQAMFVHGIPWIIDMGFSRMDTAFAFSLVGFGNLGSKIIWGWSLQRYTPKKVAAAAYTHTLCGITLILLASNGNENIVLMIGCILFGMGFGGTIPNSEYLWASYFGRRYLGSVRSIGMPFTIIFGAIGPIVVAYFFDITGNYILAFIGVISSYLFAIVIMLNTNPPNTRKHLMITS